MQSPTTAEELQRYDPHWCLFWGRPVRGLQFDIWQPYIRRSRYRFAILSSQNDFSDGVRKAVADLPDCVILEPFEDVVRWLKLTPCPSLRGFLYVGTKQDNFRLVNKFGRYLHVRIGHGESDKVYNAPRTASVYDSVFMANYDALRRYPRTIRAWVASGACAIGIAIPEGTQKDPWPRPRPVRTVLYAPTWEGHTEQAAYTSLPEAGPAFIAALPRLTERGTRVVMRPHGSTGARRPELRALIDEILAAGAVRGTDKQQDFLDADVMVSDISGVTSEFLFTEKPTIIPLSGRLAGLGRGEDRLRREYPWVQLWDPSKEDLVAAIEGLEGEDPLRPARAKAARRLFRGHRSLDDAVRSFDLALDSVRFRKRRYVPVRWVYEIRRNLARLGVGAAVSTDPIRATSAGAGTGAG